MKKINSVFFLFTGLLITAAAHAQEGAGKTAFGSFMRSTGRSYVVIAVMLTILIGLFLYLVRLDKKISKIEKETM